MTGCAKGCGSVAPRFVLGETIDARFMQPFIVLLYFVLSMFAKLNKEGRVSFKGLFQIRSSTDASNFDSYPRDEEIPPDEFSGWDELF